MTKLSKVVIIVHSEEVSLLIVGPHIRALAKIFRRLAMTFSLSVSYVKVYENKKSQ